MRIRKSRYFAGNSASQGNDPVLDAGVSPHELDVLDGATREAQKNLLAMAADLERVNTKLDAIFAEMDKNPTRRA